MAIKGNLREAGLPDVLQLLSMGPKTVCLSRSERYNFGYIVFDRGRIREPLGRLSEYVYERAGERRLGTAVERLLHVSSQGGRSARPS